ncbi:amidohydrolase family protein [Agromyces intestinalis]|uniref:Amidohydrolase family protein n=1 Tax=Agromyces intestinalis TaxID=2592652 RepID=A0A5C1YHW9_9MICO|nr:amidohydrolase family protein [Agromyces intestinalis]QEO15806.1 amidohydrolase family protein [Agromyces intestinalis]
MSRVDRALVLAGGRLPGRDAPVDVHVVDGAIAAIAPAGVVPEPEGADRVALEGRYVIPGLWDRHVHMSQWAMAARRLDLAAAESAAATAALVGASIAGGATEVIGFGFRDGLWADAPSLAMLDGVAGDVPVVLVAADLHCCWVNTAAARRHGVVASTGDGGLLREDDCFALVRALDDVPADVLDAWVADAAAAAAARGVVGVVDYEMRWNRDDWARRVGGGLDLLRVSFGIYPQHLERALDERLRTGDSVPGTNGLVRVGGAKVITDGSLNTRTAWCFDPYPGLGADEHPHGVATVPHDELVPHLRRARAGGIAPAVHAIGDQANARVLDAFEAVSPGGWHGRAAIEHAQLLRHEDVARFAALGVVASVQPEHAMDDRDVADRYWAGRTDRAFMLAELAAAGVELALGSDAPVAPLDPWVAVSAAVGRARDGREPWHPEQAVEARVALAASTNGAGYEVRQGVRADLAVVELDPLAVPADRLRTMPVAATLLGGRFTHSTLG